MNTGRNRLIATILVILLCFSLLPAAALATDTKVIYMDFEGCNLGMGFYIEPTKMEVPADWSVAQITKELLDSYGYWTTHSGGSGDVTSDGYYPASVVGFDNGINYVPDYIVDNYGPTLEDCLDYGAEGDGYGGLGQFDYSFMAGWCLTVDRIVALDDGYYMDKWEVVKKSGGAVSVYDSTKAAGAYFSMPAGDVNVTVKLKQTDEDEKPGVGSKDGHIPPDLVPQGQWFIDVEPEDWPYEYVQFMAERGFVKGKTVVLFDPDAAITRAEFITILARVSEQAFPPAGSSFTDVNPDEYYAQTVVRWQFTLEGLGADFGLSFNDEFGLGGMGGDPYYNHADKTELMRAICDYPDSPARQNGLDILINPLASQETVDSVTDSIASGQDHDSSSDTESGINTGGQIPVDDSSLKLLIDEAHKLNESDYIAESWQDFADELVEAEKVYNAANRSQISINQAELRLQTYMDRLVLKPGSSVTPAPDADALHEAIVVAKSKKESDYTPGSWDNLQLKLAKAEWFWVTAARRFLKYQKPLTLFLISA